MVGLAFVEDGVLDLELSRSLGSHRWQVYASAFCARNFQSISLNVLSPLLIARLLSSPAEVTCRANEAVPNGQSFYRGRRVGDQRYVECDEGYSLSTDQQSICLPSGNWSTVICEGEILKPSSETFSFGAFVWGHSLKCCFYYARTRRYVLARLSRKANKPWA